MSSGAPELRPLKVLAVDGGGIRGIVPATMLIALQERLDRPVVEYFDIVAGTSTGGLVGAGLCTPDSSGARPRYAVEDLLDFYLRDGREIFHRGYLHTICSLDGLLGPKYPAAGIDAFLEQRFGALELKDALKTLVLVSYDLARRRPHVFSSELARRQPERNFLLRDACRASAAAPTYFPPASVRSLAGASYLLVDGGVCANDPSLAAFVAAEEEVAQRAEERATDHDPGDGAESDVARPLDPYAGRPILVVSLGTGNLSTPLDGNAARRWGLVGWAEHILDVMADGQSRMSERCLQRLVDVAAPAGWQYRRLQPTLPPGLGRLDDTSDANVAGLERAARDYCARADTARLIDSIAADLAN
jgi:patatin-like phospholipase/acyl hydrolase